MHLIYQKKRKLIKLNLLANIPNYEKVDSIFKGMFNLDLFFKEVIFKELNDLKFQEAINIFANNILNLKTRMNLYR